MQHKLSAIAGVVSLSLFLSACSSEDEDVPLLPNATSSGVVSGFGSVYVNGLRYTTNDSSFIGNDTESNEEALKVGMKVIIKANQSGDNDPTAIEVKYIADAIGEIKDIDLAAKSLTILGQTYFINDATKFDGVTFNELRIDDSIELSGFEDEKGSFVVSYLAVKDETGEQQLLGKVSKLNKIEKTFTIGNLLVNYGAAGTVIKGTLSNGVKVSIKSDSAPNSDELSADEITVQGLVLVVGGTLTVAGFIDDIDQEDDGKTIEIDGLKYLLTDESDFTLGDEDDLKEGSYVTLVSTVMQGEPGLQTPSYPINSIRVELADEVSLEGIVEEITDTGFIIFGREFSVDNYTQYEDNSAQALRYFNFSDIAIDDKLDIDAYEVDGVLISRKIDREETGVKEPGPHDIEGVVDSIDTELFSFSVQGIQVLTNEKTDFEDASNQADFFSTLEVNAEVEVEVTYDGNDWIALDVEVDGEGKDNDVELLGTIDTFTSVINFTVNGHQVTTNLKTDFENGSASDLNKGALIEVEGIINSGGELVAEEIEFVQAIAD